MKTTLLRSTFSLCLLLVLACPAAWGVPACPYPIPLVQSDGTSGVVFHRGDEFFHWTEAPSGHTLVQNAATGYWEYAALRDNSLVPSGTVYSPFGSPPAGTAPHMIPAPRRLGAPDFDKKFGYPPTKPVSGKRNILVVLVSFRNQALTTKTGDWEGAFFGATASLAKYYKDQSKGKLEIVSARGGAAVLSVALAAGDVNDGKHPQGFIDVGGDENVDEQHKNEVAFVTAVAQKATAAGVDFAAFDTNKDGALTPDELCLYMIVAGYEQSGSKLTPSVWAHAWKSWMNESDEHIVFAGGKKLTSWSMNGELYAKGTRMPFGVVAHELGHQLCALPDLYDTSKTNSGIGAFSIMAGGSWGKKAKETSGTTPTNLDAWSRLYLGWATATTPASGVATFGEPGNKKYDVVKLVGTSHRKTEYFLLEVRRPSGWDQGLEGLEDSFADFDGGVLILHLDEEVGTPSANDFNKYVKGKHQGNMVKEADGPHLTKDAESDGTKDTLWYQGNPNYEGDGTFSATSSPNSNFHDGTASGFSLREFSASGAVMTAKISAPGPTPTPIPAPTDMPEPDPEVTGGVPLTSPTPVPQEELPAVGEPNPSGVRFAPEEIAEIFGDGAEATFVLVDIGSADIVEYATPDGTLTLALASETLQEDDVIYRWIFFVRDRVSQVWDMPENAWDRQDTPPGYATLTCDIEDGGSFDLDGVVDGSVVVGTLEALVGVPGADSEPTGVSAGHRGGCDGGIVPLGALLLLAPLAAMGRRRGQAPERPSDRTSRKNH